MTDHVPRLTATSLILYPPFLSFRLYTLSFPSPCTGLYAGDVELPAEPKKSPVHFLIFSFPTNHNNKKESLTATESQLANAHEITGMKSLKHANTQSGKRRKSFEHVCQLPYGHQAIGLGRRTWWPLLRVRPVPHGRFKRPSECL